MSLKSILKLFIGSVFCHSGAFELCRSLRKRSGKRLTILTYHRVTGGAVDRIADSLPYLFVNANTFERQLMFLKRHYKIIPLSQLEETRSGNSLPANSLIITFDDGYEDNFTTAYPILLRNKVPFSIFLVSDWVKNQGVPWWDDLYYRLRKIQGINLSEGKPRLNQLGVWLAAQFERDPSKLFSVLGTWEWDQIKKALESLNSFEESTSALQHHNRPLTWEMAKEMQGLGEFGSHGCFHQALTRIDLTEVRKHAVLSKREIERNLEKPVMAFCYPSGKWSIPVKKIISESGYPYAVTQDKGINNLRDKHALKRINIWEGTGNVGSGKFSEALFAFRLSGF